MFNALFTIILNLMASIVQLVMTPFNLIITNTLPDVSDKIMQVTNVFSTVFNNLAWATSIIPSSLKEILLFILLCEIAKHTIFLSTHVLTKVWTIIQKLKFW